MEKTCLTAAAISGPIPSPGKRVARIRLEEESEEEKERLKGERGPDELGLRRRRLRIWEPIIICRRYADSRLGVLREENQESGQRFYSAMLILILINNKRTRRDSKEKVHRMLPRQSSSKSPTLLQFLIFPNSKIYFFEINNQKLLSMLISK